MKTVSLLPLLLAAVVLAYVGHRAGAPSTYVPASLAADHEAIPNHLRGDVPEGMVVRSFHVTGMCCEGCVGKLYHSLAAVEGVHEAAVDFQAAKAEAVVPADFGVDTLLTALAFDKYTAEPTN